jgi:hypothetical protein
MLARGFTISAARRLGAARAGDGGKACHERGAAVAFHLVLPSMLRYGFSGKPQSTGWGPDRIARGLGPC